MSSIRERSRTWIRFRIGNIGDIHPSDVTRLLKAVESSMYWKNPPEHI